MEVIETGAGVTPVPDHASRCRHGSVCFHIDHKTGDAIHLSDIERRLAAKRQTHRSRLL
jgi:hypothetical protein